MKWIDVKQKLPSENTLIIGYREPKENEIMELMSDLKKEWYSMDMIERELEKQTGVLQCTFTNGHFLLPIQLPRYASSFSIAFITCLT